MAVSPGLKRSRGVCCRDRGRRGAAARAPPGLGGVELVARRYDERTREEQDKKIIRQEQSDKQRGEGWVRGRGRQAKLIGIVRAEDVGGERERKTSLKPRPDTGPLSSSLGGVAGRIRRLFIAHISARFRVFQGVS